MKSIWAKVYRKITKYRKEPVKNPLAAEFEVDNGVVSHFILRKIIPIVGISPFPLNELQLMVSAVCRFRPAYIFEWGTHVGKSARIFFETVEYFKISTEIHSIDLPDDIQHVENPHSKRGKLVKGKKNVYLHLGDGLDTALKIYGNIPSQSTVLFFVDGDHEYASVKRELEGILRAAPGAKILLHDTFYQSAGSGYNIGPNRAIKEVMEQEVFKGRYKLMSTQTGLPGMTLIY